MELAIKPGGYAELLVIDITISVRGYIGDCPRFIRGFTVYRNCSLTKCVS